MKMARQAGAERSCINDEVWMLAMAETSFENFAALVADAEREASAKVCDARYTGDNNREDMEARRCAEAIRARGNK
jgi:hypothetical protein